MQTVYNSSMAKGLPGMLADLNRNKHVESRVNGEDTAEIPFGVVVAEGDAHPQVVLPTDDADKLVGVVLRADVYAPGYDVGDTGIKPQVPVSLLQSGMVYMFPEADVEEDDPVYVRYDDDGELTQLGAVSNAAGTGLVLWPAARWAEPGTAGTATKMEVSKIAGTAAVGVGA